MLQPSYSHLFDTFDFCFSLSYVTIFLKVQHVISLLKTFTASKTHIPSLCEFETKNCPSNIDNKNHFEDEVWCIFPSPLSIFLFFHAMLLQIQFTWQKICYLSSNYICLSSPIQIRSETLLAINIFLILHVPIHVLCEISGCCSSFRQKHCTANDPRITLSKALNILQPRNYPVPCSNVNGSDSFALRDLAVDLKWPIYFILLPRVINF